MNNIDTLKFLLDGKDKIFNVNLRGNRKILPEDDVISTINANDVYENEKSKSNIFRLVISINPFCSNILFNPFTEVIYKEGSTSAYCLNFVDKKTSDLESKNEIIGKRLDFKWTEYEAVRDTQLSNVDHGFDYNCGLDIFNNHLLRSRTFKSVNYSKSYSMQKINRLSPFYGDAYSGVTAIDNIHDNDETMHVYTDNNFNTIDDYLRDKFGIIVSEEVFIPTYYVHDLNQWKIMPMHLYQKYDAYTFDECIENKKLNDNGWYGFSNSSTFSYLNFNVFDKNGNITTRAVGDVDDNNNINVKSNEIFINKTINSKKYCEFIDLYPGRNLYSFTPNYNKYRRRLEYNWNYCLTYPSKSVIRVADYKEFPFLKVINENNTALKALMIDELTENDSGVSVLTVYSVSQHGLQNGDLVNIYKQYEEDDATKNDLVYVNSEVTVIDKYTFQVAKTERNISNEWIELEKAPNNYVTTYKGKNYKVCASKRCNVDDKAQDIYFKRVVNGVECKYYVRKFSRLPNFKFAEEEINDYYLYDEEFNKKRAKEGKETLLYKYSTPTNKKSEFESHIADLGFSKNAYGDNNAEIVFTDDINVSFIKDNLGRPLSEIYLTIIKNNKGYKKWYGFNEYEIETNSEDIEYSHCFGKNNCGFLLSDYYRIMFEKDDVRSINSSNEIGLLKNKETDEIDFYTDNEFYGDLCCYSPIDCEEEVIQKVMNRFNTVQREINIPGNANRFKASKYFKDLVVDEIQDSETNLEYIPSKTRGYFGDYDDGYKLFNGGYAIHSKKVKYGNMSQQTEGYYYLPHYKIQIKNVSGALSTSDGIKYEIYSASKAESSDENVGVFEIKTLENNGFEKNEKLILYKKSTNEYFYITIIKLLTDKKFDCNINNEDGTYISSSYDLINSNNIGDFILLKKHEDTPDYAKLIKDGSCRFGWREVLPNGSENDDVIYPFTNGAFYILKQINFFLRRQDPTEEFLYGLLKNKRYKNLIPKDGEFISHKVEDFDNYFSENEFKRC